MNAPYPTETEIKDTVREVLAKMLTPQPAPISETIADIHTDSLVEMLAPDEGFTDEPNTEHGSSVALIMDVPEGAL